MREKLISVGDDYWIEDDAGSRAFKVNGKVARIRDSWVLEDLNGNEVASIRERKLSVRDAIKIEVGGLEATVKKAMIGLRDRFHVEIEHGKDLTVKGNIVDHDYEIERDGKKIAEVSKKWLRARDTYGVEVRDEADVVLVLAVTVAVDALAHD
ncbi:MAG: LURP-one-related/scramblase family protein [Aeromicrobium sp.]